MWSYVSGLFLGGYYHNQFLRALRSGDTAKANFLYKSKPKLRESIQPNVNLGSEHNENTFLHYAALYGLQEMYQDLLKHKGKPDMKNSQRRNCLHLICLHEDSAANRDATKRGMLEQTVTEGLEGMDLQHLLAEKDENGNTALHLAAGAGLKACVELLLSYEADMVATNEEGLTPADLAKAKNHNQIATSLEARMVFSDLAEPLEPVASSSASEEPVATRMHDRDLRSMKDTLLIETSEMLGVSLLSAEVLLKHYGWSKEELLQAWLQDPTAVCEEVGIERPTEGVHEFGSLLTQQVGVAEGGAECGICFMPYDNVVQVSCGHLFCVSCWKEYLEEKIERGESQSISCPEYGCYKFVPPEVIETVVSQDMAAKFLSFDIKAFVDSNPNIRWCPSPGCSQAVGRPAVAENPELSPSHSSEEVKGQTVVCGSGHYFCWSCLGAAHEPCTCSQWLKWLDHCNEMRGKIGDTTAAEADEAASSKWLVNNSKPCPKCKAPIEKTEGCNHMCCKYCRHDFCWVCLEEWKCHNSATGGYFNCNRYDAQRKATLSLDHRKQEALKDYREWEKISKFLHYYERYKEHIKSYQLEEPFLDKAQEKMMELAQSVQHLESGQEVDLSFIHEAVEELLKCRRVLKATYAYGYYLTGIISTKQFEHMQGALEQVTEMLAEAVARPHLRKPRLEIIRLTREAREKRAGLVKNVQSGLPLSSHPFIDSAGGFPWGDGSSSRHSSARLHRFLRDLDTYKPREGQASPSGTSVTPNTDEEFLRALEVSRQEFEADQQMTADVELAKTLSLQNSVTTPTQDTPPTPVGNSWLDQLSFSHTDTFEEPYVPWPPDTTPYMDTAPHMDTDPPLSPYLPSPPTSPFSPGMPSPTTPPPQSFSPPPASYSTDPGLLLPGAEWGPVYSEEEDLRKAIEDSLQASNTTNETDLMAMEHSNQALFTADNGHATIQDNFTSHNETRTRRRKKEALLVGHRPPKPKKATSRDQFVGAGYHRRTSYDSNINPFSTEHDRAPSTGHRRKRHSRGSHHFDSEEGTQPQQLLLAEDTNTDSLPSPLQQLLDRNDRLGTNV